MIPPRVLPSDINNAANDTHISIVDADGVALAAIQGRNAKLEETARDGDREIAGLRAELVEPKGQLGQPPPLLTQLPRVNATRAR